MSRASCQARQDRQEGPGSVVELGRRRPPVPPARLAAVQRCRKLACLWQIPGRQGSRRFVGAERLACGGSALPQAGPVACGTAVLDVLQRLPFAPPCHPTGCPAAAVNAGLVLTHGRYRAISTPALTPLLEHLQDVACQR
jgi:hypothetical protein